MDAPVGVLKEYEMVSPGITIRFEMSKAPIIFMPTAMITAHIIAKMKLQRPTLIPAARAYSLSKVTAKKLLYINM